MKECFTPLTSAAFGLTVPHAGRAERVSCYIVLCPSLGMAKEYVRELLGEHYGSSFWQGFIEQQDRLYIKVFDVSVIPQPYLLIGCLL